MRGRWTGRTYRRRHVDPFSRRRCPSTTLAEFEVRHPIAAGDLWVHCSTCGTTGELAKADTQPTKRGAHA